MDPDRYHNPAEELLEREPLQQLQRQRLARQLQEITGPNRFYTRKFAGISFDPLRDPLDKLPFTTRKELEAAHE